MDFLLLACTAAAFAGVIILLLNGTGLIGRPRADDATQIHTRL